MLRGSLWDTRILDAISHHNNVMEVVISRPNNFEYKAGQYIMIRIPAISMFEWHPYSLTSCPYDGDLRIFLKQSGDWSTDVYRRLYDGPGSELPAIAVDGPFGAPAQSYPKFGIILLIGAGIGITPFASIIRNLICWSRKNNRKISKIYFHWVIKDIADLEWFYELLHVINDHDILDATIWVTRNASPDPRSDLDLKIGRPDWDALFDGINTMYSNRMVGVFYCGPPTLARVISGKAAEYGRLGSNNITFHIERF